MSSAVQTIFGIVLLLVIVALYWAPTLLAGTRHVPNVASIAVINGLLGWTLVGWAVALAMAVRDAPPSAAPAARVAPVEHHDDTEILP